jgi:hypothetical protein
MWKFGKKRGTTPIPVVIEKRVPELVPELVPEPEPDDNDKAALAYEKERKNIEARDAARKINEELSNLADKNLSSYTDIVTINLDTLKDDILQKYEAIQNKITTELKELVSTTSTSLKNIDTVRGNALVINFNKNLPLKPLESMNESKIALAKSIESIKHYLKVYLREPLYESIKVASEGQQNYFSILGPGNYSNGGSSKSSKKRRKPIKKRRNTKRRN